MQMTELAIRESLVFGGAVAGAVWGYFLGKLLERRRLVREVRSSLEALERWAVKVCDGLDALEHSLPVPAPDPVEGANVANEVGAASPVEPQAPPAVRRLVSGLGTAP
jgi:hypothetical protein